MYLNLVPSEKCSVYSIRLSGKLRQSLQLGLGDILVFNTPKGPQALTVDSASMDELLQYGEEQAFVSPYSPVLASKESDVYIQRHQLTLGADPELFIVDEDGRVVPAYTLLSYEGKLGSDGDLAEIRPDFALDPDQLTENIRDIIRTIPKRIPKRYKALAESFYALRCCGFHVHVGIPVELLSFAADQTDMFFKNVVSTLDYLVGIPSAALDISDRRRLSWEYGRPGDYRLSMRTFEYRTPGGFHLKTPKYTRSLLTTTFKVMERIIHEAEDLSGGWVDMQEVANFDYFRKKYDIPPRQEINSILRSEGRYTLERESKRVNKILPSIVGELTNSLVTTRVEKTGNLIQEWLGDAT